MTFGRIGLNWLNCCYCMVRGPLCVDEQFRPVSPSVCHPVSCWADRDKHQQQFWSSQWVNEEGLLSRRYCRLFTIGDLFPWKVLVRCCCRVIIRSRHRRIDLVVGASHWQQQEEKQVCFLWWSVGANIKTGNYDIFLGSLEKAVQVTKNNCSARCRRIPH